jgi:uncharacterized membrane protein YtjA (UPF0391 family)
MALRSTLIYWAIIFLIIAIIAYLLGWGFGLAWSIAWLLIGVFLILFVISLVAAWLGAASVRVGEQYRLTHFLTARYGKTPDLSLFSANGFVLQKC